MRPFNIHDRSAVQAAESAGLIKAREIADALCQLRIAGEWKNLSEISPIVTAGQHDLYQRLVEECLNYGVSKKTAHHTAIDLTFRNLGADSSPHIRAAHDQIKAKYLAAGAEQRPEAALAINERPTKKMAVQGQHFQQRLMNVGVRVGVAKELSDYRDDAMMVAGNPGVKRSGPTFAQRLDEAGVNAAAREQFVQEFRADIEKVQNGVRSKSPVERLVRIGLKFLYERVYVSLNVHPYVADRAATDAARGLGAQDSEHIKAAHERVNGQPIALPQLKGSGL